MMVHFRLVLSRRLRAEIARVATREGVTAAEVVRRAVRAYVRNGGG